MLSRVFALVVVVGGTSVVSAQCTLGISNVPDLDQRRFTLPGNGDMYCAPTSVVNWAAYMANHGLPQVMSGPRDFQSQSNYAYATSVLSTMGAFMSTDPVDGSSALGMYNGAKLYFLLNAPGKVSVTQRWVGNGSLSPFWMFYDMALGRMVCLCYARYSPMGGTYVRTGGHCVSVTKVIDACSAEPTVWFRDPATDETYSSQSGFASKATSVVEENVTTNAYGTRKLWRLSDLGTAPSRRYIDCLLVLHPNFVVTKDPKASGWAIHNVIQLATNSHLPAQQSFQTPNGLAIQAMALSPDMRHVALLTTPAAGNAALYAFALGDGSVRTLANLTTPTSSIAYTRFGDLVVCDRTLRVYDVEGPTGVLKHQVVPANPVADLDYDDQTDQIVVLEPDARRFVLYNKTLDGPISKPLPSGVPAGASSFFAIGNLLGQYFVSSPDDPGIYEAKLAPDGSGRLVRGDTITLPAAQRPEGLRVTNEGTLIVVKNQRTVELEKDSRTGEWREKPDSDFDGLDAVGDPIISRSRTNFDPAVHTGPGFINILDQEVIDGPEFIECPCSADADGSGGTPDSTDIEVYFSEWLRGDLNADADCSGGTPDTTDIAEFFAQWLAGGC